MVICISSAVNHLVTLSQNASSEVANVFLIRKEVVESLWSSLDCTHNHRHCWILIIFGKVWLLLLILGETSEPVQNSAIKVIRLMIKGNIFYDHYNCFNYHHHHQCVLLQCRGFSTFLLLEVVCQSCGMILKCKYQLITDN